MFLYKGGRKWQNTIKEWDEQELATLYYCLETALEGNHDVEVRRSIVYLLEKLYAISDSVDTRQL